MEHLKISIVYDNETASERFEKGWGFSCLVAGDEKILFDTGWDGNLLIRNLQKLGFTPDTIDKVVISHSHWDHAGGLSTLLNLNDHLTVYLPPSISKNLKREIGKRATTVEVKKGMRIGENCLTTGELGKTIKEQSLLVETREGLLVVTGCSHPGVEEILREARRYGNVCGILGGFHGFENLEAIKDLKLVVPCHCTKKKREIENYTFATRCGVGLELFLKKP